MQTSSQIDCADYTVLKASQAIDVGYKIDVLQTDKSIQIMDPSMPSTIINNVFFYMLFLQTGAQYGPLLSKEQKIQT